MVEADDGGCEGVEGFVEFGHPVALDGEPPEGAEPGVRPLDRPAEDAQDANVRAAPEGDRGVDGRSRGE